MAARRSPSGRARRTRRTVGGAAQQARRAYERPARFECSKLWRAPRETQRRHAPQHPSCALAPGRGRVLIVPPGLSLCHVAAVACQQWRYNDGAGTFVVHAADGDSAPPLCLRRFPEAKSFAAWTCSGAADERFVPDGTAAGATAFCTGEGEARACVVLVDASDA